ncbi:hypothetical protein [Candidatus Neptunichlamydia sp. REUL1]|uniref:hypothetical protein n=1 Tax=Candidatus Neptunichlamydia sp. REUL1 TaxID=3064277 RepID=UPI00292E79B5|nr:hypothetical protein [Candidatus Neptunochlamydia sp. REUL1]
MSFINKFSISTKKYGLLLVFLLISTSVGTCNEKGLLIVGAGLPASGKSSVMKELGKLLMTENVFLEPEEKTWPQELINPLTFQSFNIITWLRAQRVSMLAMGGKLRDHGEVVVVDSYYDKILSFYLGKEDHFWLMKPDNVYFNALKEIAELDTKILPNADYIIFFKVDKNTWVHFLKKRNRINDENLELVEFFEAQESILDAVKLICHKTGSKMILIEQKIDTSPREAAKKIKELIETDTLHMPFF